MPSTTASLDSGTSVSAFDKSGFDSDVRITLNRGASFQLTRKISSPCTAKSVTASATSQTFRHGVAAPWISFTGAA